MAGFPGTTPTSQPQASALLSNAAANAGLTNATPFDRLTNLEQVVANLLTDLPALIKSDRVNAITAFATGGQASATALTGSVNRVTVCATAGDSVKLPSSAAGYSVSVINSGAAAVDIFPATGDLIDTLAANTAIRVASGSAVSFYCAVAGTWNSSPTPLPYAKYTTDATGVQTVPAGLLTGAAFTCAQNTANGSFSWTPRTASQMFADTPNARVGDKYMLLITNTGNGTVTLAAGATGITLTGTMTMATNTTRLFAVTFTSASAVTIQSVSIGTIA